VLWQQEAPASSKFKVSGTVEDWRARIGSKCVGNAKLMVCVSMAFAGPFLYLANEPGGGIHLVGISQFGKTITQIGAGSVWGGGDIDGFLETWRATANGLEGVAEAHCDTFLPLNELGEIAPREAGETAYMLANGSGKSRARRDGSPRRRAKWRILFLSSGEISLADKMSEAGKRPQAGQEVRLADIGADAGAGHGIFTELHGAASSGAFAEELRLGAMSYYGSVGRGFLERLTAAVAEDAVGFRDRLGDWRNRFLEKCLPENASGQVRSVCGRFALIAAAGTLATQYGITGWEVTAAGHAAESCFKDWLAERGTAGDREIEAGIAQVIAYIEAHGASRFEAAWEPEAERPIHNRVGFRRRADADGGEAWEYMILAEQWSKEIAKGCNARNLAREMVRRELMIPGENSKTAQSIRVPGYGKTRLYVLAPNIIGRDA
jgi:uncharacterized protein (DUF927 family)